MKSLACVFAVLGIATVAVAQSTQPQANVSPVAPTTQPAPAPKFPPLAPPKVDLLMIAMPPAALPVSPQPWPKPAIVNVPVRNWLPAAEALAVPRFMPIELAQAAPVRRIAEPLNLPVGEDRLATFPPLQMTRVLPTYPLPNAATVVPADVADLSSLPRRARPNSARAEVNADATLDLSLGQLLRTNPLLRLSKAPFLKLSIPIPADSPDVLPIRTTMPDDDPPVIVPRPFPRPTLPLR